LDLLADNGEPEWLTTGDAARICSVERDTVLKWIKRGRIPASRTVGGHYRISSRDLDRLLAPTPREPAAGAALPLRCWEYLAVEGKTRHECRKCLAYQVGATWCFRLRRWPGVDPGLICCASKSCEDCAYYRQVAGHRLRSTDPAAVRSLL
jgi:excisionase family DNA binding protein